MSGKDDLRERLTPEQYHITQEGGTERPFENAYWKNKEPGIYVDIVSGEPLFSSLDKFDSGTGWPSFTRPLVVDNIVRRADFAYGMLRMELRSAGADSHLGHVFDDGPPEQGGRRYCINSAALRFIPMDRLEEEGYGEFRSLFRNEASSAAREIALLAGGCFWGVEEILRNVPGVVDTVVGYTGGDFDKPTYEDIKTGRTGHAEAVRVEFDPSRTSYEAILEVFFRLHDPTTLNQQGNDRGTQYRSAIFALDDEQRKLAEAVKERVARSGKWSAPIVTEVVKAGTFYEAENYHQDYLQRNPHGYNCHYLRD